MSAKTSNPARRRARPVQPALSRDTIVAAALAILREEGLGTATMRRVAAALDTGQASLYAHIRDTADLHAQILDALLGEVALAPPPAGPWRERLKGLLRDYALVLFRHPEIARMAMSTQPSGPHYLALLDALLALLREGGVGDREAAWAVDLLLLYATAIAAENSARKPAHRTAEIAALAARLAADAGRYPQIARVGPELVAGEGLDRFSWGLDVLITGVLGTPRARPLSPARPPI